MKLTQQEILVLVNHWIGVEGGYLGDFSYRTHREFYPLECGLDIDPDLLGGTTRERFIEILSSESPENQARILRGVMNRFPLGVPGAPVQRTPQLRRRLLDAIARLEGAGPVAMPLLEGGSEAVVRAISDAEVLLQSGGPTSALDRVHTALHGFLVGVLDEAGIAHDPEAPTTSLFSLLRRNHSAFADNGKHADRTTAVLRSLAGIVDALVPLRNKASLAHPASDLLDAPEAMLAINAARTLLHYVEGKLAGQEP